jgi:hypothetical protein
VTAAGASWLGKTSQPAGSGNPAGEAFSILPNPESDVESMKQELQQA